LLAYTSPEEPAPAVALNPADPATPATEAEAATETPSESKPFLKRMWPGSWW
jgi:hypothetical protein